MTPEIIIIATAGLLIGKFVIRYYKPIFKGKIGELKVSLKLNRLNKTQYFIYHDINLIKNGRSTQIDHLIISIYGIFVIETKNYKGWIFGNEKSEYWAQSIYGSNTKFRNPIKQNISHILFLKKLLYQFDTNCYHPIIVFSGSAELRQIDADAPVLYSSELLRYIKAFTTPILSIEDVDEISSIIYDEIEASKKIKGVNHKKLIKRAKLLRESKIKDLQCPNCDGKLIKKHGKYGMFYGCANYPRCKFSRDL